MPFHLLLKSLPALALLFVILEACVWIIYWPTPPQHAPPFILPWPWWTVAGRRFWGSGCPFTIYVYRLPTQVLLSGMLRSNGSYIEHERLGFGPSLSGFAAGGFHDTDQFYLAKLFIMRLAAHPCVVTDPTKAQVFYIPYFRQHVWNGECSEEERHLAGLLDRVKDGKGRSFFRRRQGHDHFIIGPRVATKWSLCPELFSPNQSSVWKNVLKLAYEAPCPTCTYRLTIGFGGDHDSSADSTDPYFSRFVSVPYPSFVHFEPSARRGVDGRELPLPWQDHSNRSRWVAFASGLHKDSKQPWRGVAVRLRRMLRDQCEEAASGDCVMEAYDREADGSEGGEVKRPFDAHRVIEAYRSSVFCLNPPGDSPSRKAIADSILLGCIPVLFHPDQLQLWPWHISNMSQTAVYVDHEELWPGSSMLLESPTDSDVWTYVRSNKPEPAFDVIDRLKAIPKSEVAAKQRFIADNAQRLQYTRIGDTSAALTPSVFYGKQTQRKQPVVEGGAADVTSVPPYPPLWREEDIRIAEEDAFNVILRNVYRMARTKARASRER
ncbi:unnamed protein product [Vitrella brassicaformis CCMP3155]|uniref:Exostosin GT47 domain-containing protein n=1 Tax=Vitrella brassicaformis (strain CCMP3155) TaxID=1169540 RepID=A0A0G4EDW2_VITBC|nr:unnamed protein product [Vitrella brassicaformis CCMP3155]|eukprot:CEL93738.1 unnamed protein product [Vitrella brassicaformis CCMP3155]